MSRLSLKTPGLLRNRFVEDHASTGHELLNQVEVPDVGGQHRRTDFLCRQQDQNVVNPLPVRTGGQALEPSQNSRKDARFDVVGVVRTNQPVAWYPPQHVFKISPPDGRLGMSGIKPTEAVGDFPQYDAAVTKRPVLEHGRSMGRQFPLTGVNIDRGVRNQRTSQPRPPSSQQIRCRSTGERSRSFFRLQTPEQAIEIKAQV